MLGQSDAGVSEKLARHSLLRSPPNLRRYHGGGSRHAGPDLPRGRHARGRALNILFLTTRPPGRSLQGYRVRAFHQLRILSRHHRITLLSFADAGIRSPMTVAAAGFCERVITVPLGRGQMAKNLLRRGMRASLPLQTAIYETDAMRQAIRQVLARERFDLVHVQLARMASYLDEVASVPRVLDFVDALSLNMRRRCEHDRGMSRWAACVEARRVGRYERAICRAVDRALVSSAVDRGAIGCPPGLETLTNGVDLGEFPFAEGGREPGTVIFSGNMGYFPNVNAVLWFHRSVWPLVRRLVPAARLRVVGARPARAIRRLVRQDSTVEVSGAVEHIGPHLARAAVAVAPLLAGSGQPLKVLEAMASGTPVVATSLAAAGLEARHGEHALIADDPRVFAEHIARVLSDPGLAARLAAHGRRLVEDRYTWEDSVGRLEAIYWSLARPSRTTA
jgi:sugar transferase (PEP-CTERM/EpsH1 system associated)